MQENPYRGPESEDRAKQPKRGRSIVVTALLVIAFLGLVVLFLLPNVRFAREAGRRSSCANGMKQISLALQNYAEKHGGFPPAYTVDTEGRPLHSWRTLILPYLEESKLYESIDLTKPWNDPANAEAFKTHVDAYDCPSRQASDNLTTYLAIVAPGSFLQPGEARKLSDVTDGAAETIAVLEVDLANAVPWMQPVDADEETFLRLNENSDLAHPGGSHAAFVDGHVSYLSAEIPSAQRRAMISIAGGDSDVLVSADAAR